MHSIAVSVIENKRHTRMLEQLDPEVQELIDNQIVRLCNPIKEEAQRLAPVDTGALRDSIRVKHSGWMQAHVRDAVPYGVYQEMGFYHWITGEHIANPFLVPALQIKTPEVLGNLKTMVFTKIERMERKAKMR